MRRHARREVQLVLTSSLQLRFQKGRSHSVYKNEVSFNISQADSHCVCFDSHVLLWACYDCTSILTVTLHKKIKYWKSPAGHTIVAENINPDHSSQSRLVFPYGHPFHWQSAALTNTDWHPRHQKKSKPCLPPIDAIFPGSKETWQVPGLSHHHLTHRARWLVHPNLTDRTRHDMRSEMMAVLLSAVSGCCNPSLWVCLRGESRELWPHCFIPDSCSTSAVPGKKIGWITQ